MRSDPYSLLRDILLIYRIFYSFVGTQVVLDTGMYNYGIACGEATIPCAFPITEVRPR